MLVHYHGQTWNASEFARSVGIAGTTAPRVTPSMRIAAEDLRLERLDVVHAGENTFPLAEGIRAVSISRLIEDLEPLTG